MKAKKQSKNCKRYLRKTKRFINKKKRSNKTKNQNRKQKRKSKHNMKGGVNVNQLFDKDDKTLKCMIYNYMLESTKDLIIKNTEVSGNIKMSNKCPDKSKTGNYEEEQLCDLLFYNIFLYMKNNMQTEAYNNSIKRSYRNNKSENIGEQKQVITIPIDIKDINVDKIKQDIISLKNDFEEIKNENQTSKNNTSFKYFFEDRFLNILIDMIKNVEKTEQECRYTQNNNNEQYGGMIDGGLVWLCFAAIMLGVVVIGSILVNIGKVITAFQKRHQSEDLRLDIEKTMKSIDKLIETYYQPKNRSIKHNNKLNNNKLNINELEAKLNEYKDKINENNTEFEQYKMEYMNFKGKKTVKLVPNKANKKKFDEVETLLQEINNTMNEDFKMYLKLKDKLDKLDKL